MEENGYTNIIYLKGEMASDAAYSHTIYGEGFYSFYFSVPRLSGKNDILPMTISERLLDFYHVRQGMTFAIEGQIRSYNKRTPEGTGRLMIAVFVKDILLEPNVDPTRRTNEAMLVGYVCKPTTYRVTPLGREITDMLIAVNRAFHKSDYIPCIIWGRNAKFAGGLNTGDKLLLSGRLQSREYEKTLPDGTVITRTAYEVSLSNIELLTKRE